MRYPRYTTYGSDEELTAAISGIDPLRQTGATAQSLRYGNTGAGGGGGLLKSHDCAILFPDGATGTCHYTRGGPAWHVFRFEHPGRSRETIRPMEKCALPTQHFTSRMDNTPTAVAIKAQELADIAYNAAVRRERDEYFRRVMPPQGHKPDPVQAMFSVKRAKEIAGRYALCIRLGNKLVPATGTLLDTLDGANAEWIEKGRDPKLHVACACRWGRRWELPRFNPCYKEMVPSMP